ncbi:MAG: signal peptidase I [Propionibacteriaceae bacterium]|jgi:signal peptidase I|nr:signal peptidase I [Propionibacteriaceae bacterium]
MSALDWTWPRLARGRSFMTASESAARRAVAGKPFKARFRLGVGRPRRGVDDDPKAGPPASPAQRAVRWLLDIVVILFAALLISTLIKTFGVQQYIVPSGSMEETLRNGDRIVVAKFGDYRRGDAVVFEDKLGWLTPTFDDPSWLETALSFVGILPPSGSRFLVKRLIGLPGDRVACCTDNRLTINDQLLDESYLYPGINPSDVAFDVTVPDGRVFVLGDHRNNSADSRYHLCRDGRRTPELAFPAIEDIEGPVISIVWPINRWSKLSTPDVFAGVPAQDQPPSEPVVRAYPYC